MKELYNNSIRRILPAMILILLQSALFKVSAQELNLTGTVKDEKNLALPGVTVSVKGTSKGTTTDKNGYFKISASANGTLIFKFVGYTIKEEAIGGRTVLEISLKPEAASLNEVIVTGVFDKRTAMNSSIAISTLNAAQISKLAPLSAADLLRSIPGVYVNSSLGEVRNTVYSRGVSVGSNDGASGYYYVSLQEDGLPITNVTFGNYGPDYYLRADATLGRLEAVRGGTASILGNNAPGGIFNYISKTGGQQFEGEFRAKVGLEGNGKNPYYRGDLDFGGPLSKDGSWTYNLGGFYRYSTGAKDPGYPLNKGGQVKANILKKYKNGSLKIYGKFLDDHNGWFEFTPSLNFNDPKPAPGFSATSSVLISPVSVNYPVNNATGLENYDSRSLIHSLGRSVGATLTQHLDSSLTFTNAIRYSRNSADWNTTGGVSPLSFSDLVTYAILGQLGKPGTYRFTNIKTGAPLGSVVSNTGYDFTVVNGNFPGAAVSPNSLFYEPLLTTKNKVSELLDQFSFTKKLADMSFTFGGFYGRSTVTNTSGVVGLGFETIQDRPQPVNLTFTNPAGQVYQQTNPDGILGLGGQGLAENHAVQNQLAFYFGHNWQITPKLNLDYGLRFESVHVNGYASQSLLDPRSQDPNYGGLDGNPLTTYDNGGGSVGPHFAFNKTVNTISYSAGLNYLLSNRFSFFGRFSSGRKAPDLTLYFGANTPFSASTLAPQAQHVTQVEGGLKLNERNFTLTATPFYSVLSHVPNVQVFSEADNITPYSPPATYATIRTYGIELDSRVDLTQNLSIKTVATFQNSKARDYTVWLSNKPGPQDDQLVSYSGNRAENAADIMLSVTPSYNVGKFYSFLSWQYLGNREANTANVFLLPAFSQFNLGAGYDLTKKIQLGLNINNLLDKYGIMSWSAPGNFLTNLDREGFTKEMYQAAIKNNAPFGTIAIPPRAYYFTFTYKF